jgi:tetrapyrrole methylase family protein/MazG family protein
VPKPPENLRDFQSLVEIIAHLRGPEGCPWDKKQTHNSLTRFAIEEAFELAEACDNGDTQHIKEELGDLLLQVVLHAEVAKQDSGFDIADVIEVLSEKMVRRHPHVFSDVNAESASEVESNWYEIKRQEKRAKGESSERQWIELPSGLPALMSAFKIGKKSKKIDFDWPDVKGVLAKVEEELGEVKEAMQSADPAAIKAELGDLLFSTAQLARHLDVDPEEALRQCNSRFLDRVDQMMEVCKEKGLDWMSLSDIDKEQIWQEAKKRAF